MSRILVAYVSRNGSTAEIARAIGKELERTGKYVDVAEMKAVRSLEGYGAAVFGGPLYMGSVVSDVKSLSADTGPGLEQIPVVAFTVGLAPANPEPAEVIEAMESLYKAIEPVTPVECQVFAGKA